MKIKKPLPIYCHFNLSNGGFIWVITRCSNNYGAYQFPEKLIPLIINNCLMHKNLPIYGEVYNIGSHNERHNIQIVKKIINYINKNSDKYVTEKLITYVEDRKGHDMRYDIDPNKIADELGWHPETTFEVGIEKTIE